MLGMSQRAPHRPDTRCTAFLDDRRLAAGELRHVALRARQALDARPDARLLIFDDRDARLIDLDLSGGTADMVQRLNRGEVPAASDDTPAKRGRGRPRLGVMPREVTLLPDHWQWLNAQPGGASLALRALVDAARHAHAQGDTRRTAQERAYRFITAIGGDLPGCAEATRALFAGDAEHFDAALARWPDDLREHATMLAADAWPA